MSSTETVVPVDSDASQVVQIARERFNEGRTRSVSFRKKQLNNVIRFVQENERAILEAVYRDFKKPEFEMKCCEIFPLIKEAKHVLNHLDEWVKPDEPKKTLVNLMDGVRIYKDPYGVVLVIGPWNYPLLLTLTPLIGAIAAGNTVVIKPSEVCPNFSRLLHDLLPKYLDRECYPVYLGGPEETATLLKERFDYIFYTGSTTVGRIVHKAATKNLTPVTLELGGKSPAYVDSSADLDKTVKRIIWGKCINSGQTCVAPDYILCTKEMQDKIVKCAQKVMLEFYGQDIKESRDFCRIIADRHFDRLVSLLSGLKIALGGRYEQKDRFIEPTIAIDVSPNHPIMQEEIFGPILPIITINNIDEAITFINKRDKPLALYIFSTRKQDQEKILKQTSSGGVCINDTVLHLVCDGLPFGGVGSSGMGAYHGKSTFDTFVHKKSVLIKDFKAIPEKVMASRYPPYTDSKIVLMKTGLTERKRVPMKYLPHFVMFLIGVGLTIAVYYLVIALA